MPQRKSQQPIEIYRRRRAAAMAVIAVVLVIFAGLIVYLWPSSTSNSLDDSPETNNVGIVPANPSALAPYTSAPAAHPEHNLPPIPPGTPKCADDDIGVSVTTDKTDYKVGERPIFKAVVTNISVNTCVRNIGTGLEKFAVLDFNGNQIWTNFDCDAQPGMKNVLLNPGQQVGFSIQWHARTSAHGCPARSIKAVPPGQYQVVSQLNMVSSKPKTFNITS